MKHGINWKTSALWTTLSGFLPLLDLDSKDLMHMYLALRRGLEEEEESAFKEQLSSLMSNNVFSFRDRVMPDTINVFEKVLSLGIKPKEVALDIREGFFMPLFSPLPLAVKHLGISKRTVFYRDPLPEHYSVRTEFHLHWSLQRGLLRTAMYILEHYPLENIDFTYRCRGFTCWDYIREHGGFVANRELTNALEEAITRKAIEGNENP